MTRTPHRPRTLVPALAASLLLTASLAGCSVTSPPTAVEPYQAADGLSVTADVLGSRLHLQNFLVVGTAKGEPGAVVGAIGYDGSEELTVTIATANDKGTPVTVKPGAIALVGGPRGTDVRIPALEVAPGAHVTLRVTAGGAPVDVLAPVVTPTGYYASFSPAATPSGSATATGTTSPDASPTAADASPSTAASPTAQD